MRIPRICRCNNETYNIRFEADFCCDALWCSTCGASLGLVSFEVSDKLKEKILSWTSNYGEWIDLETDSLIEGAEGIQRKFNEEGLLLYEEFKKELGEVFTVEYTHAISVSWYQNSGSKTLEEYLKGKKKDNT